MPPVTVKLAQLKFEALTERIWAIALLSVLSRITFIDGYSLIGDLVRLKKEISFYYDQFDLNEQSFKRIDETGDTTQVWTLIRDGEGRWLSVYRLMTFDHCSNTDSWQTIKGIKSLLKQASADQKEEDLLKMMKVLPLMGSNVSFTSTYSVLNFILVELLSLSKRLLPTRQYHQFRTIEREPTLTAAARHFVQL